MTGLRAASSMKATGHARDNGKGTFTIYQLGRRGEEKFPRDVEGNCRWKITQRLDCPFFLLYRDTATHSVTAAGRLLAAYSQAPSSYLPWQSLLSYASWIQPLGGQRMGWGHEVCAQVRPLDMKGEVEVHRGAAQMP